MLHLVKLAVGIRDLAHLREVQQERARSDPPLRHFTRNFPRRSEEILAGGSLYWVIGGAIVVRQRIVGLSRTRWEDGSPCAAVELDWRLIAVAARPTKPFQGWRYLEAAAAPPDLGPASPSAGEAELPAQLRRELRSLGLL
jgi:hypothetical protein